MEFISHLTKSLQPRIDCDAADRLSCFYTTSFLLFLVMVVSAKQFVGSPLECWLPAEFTLTMAQYAESYCWVQNTYWLPIGSHIPQDYGTRLRASLSYYQWVPFILLAQAFAFFIPALLWRNLSTAQGYSVNVIDYLMTQSMHQTVSRDQVNDRSKQTPLCNHLCHIFDLQYQRKIHQPRRQAQLWLRNFHVTFANYCEQKITASFTLSSLYLLTKATYFANAVTQFYFLNRLLGSDSRRLYGFEVLKALLDGVDWRNSGFFPRVNLCDFDVRVLGNIHRYTVQCVLTINLFTEKIFLLLWFWYILLATIALYRSKRIAFLLVNFEQTANGNWSLLPQKVPSFNGFVDQFLGIDGIFILRLISANFGDVTTAQLVQGLWSHYYLKHVVAKNATRNLRIAGRNSAFSNSNGTVWTMEDEQRRNAGQQGSLFQNFKGIDGR